jgi:CheY-like chemotaxis protein
VPRGDLGEGVMKPNSHKPLVLLVDDEEGIRDGLSTWLAQDYEVITAGNGLEALELLTHLERMPDVVVADVWMPCLDGINMVRQLRERPAGRHVPVIFLTGQTSVRSMIDGIASGARAYLTKPVDLDKLERKLRSAIHANRRGPSQLDSVV